MGFHQEPQVRFDEKGICKQIVETHCLTVTTACHTKRSALFQLKQKQTGFVENPSFINGGE